jgi:hypothetical protein
MKNMVAKKAKNILQNYVLLVRSMENIAISTTSQIKKIYWDTKIVP